MRSERDPLPRRNGEPFAITDFRIPHCAGIVGLAGCPGHMLAPSFRRTLDDDLHAIQQWGARVVVTLLDASELDRHGVPDLGDSAERIGLEWVQLPIADQCAPGAQFERGWLQMAPGLHQRLHDGEHVLIHCSAGVGRSGTIAARLAVEHGASPEGAIARVRRVRPGAIESEEQHRYILERSWLTPRIADGGALGMS